MKKAIGFAALALVFAGCSSITDVTRINSRDVRTDDGAQPIAEVAIHNVSYRLFGCIPISSGEVWKGQCKYADRDERNTVWFEDKCTPEENLAALKAVLKEVGSDRVQNLVERTQTWSGWSLGIFRQTKETTTCTVLK